MSKRLAVDVVLSFCKEMVAGKGEDCFCHSFRDDTGLLAVFDGCGGAGARTHEFFSGATEAYMASRLCAGAFYDLFCAEQLGRLAPKEAARRFAELALERLKSYTPPDEDDGVVFKGSMVRTLPTTAAAALVRSVDEQTLEVSAMWAGDSRVYVLDANGLAQLTTDDTSVPDPMDNLYEDGVLRNIFCSDREVQLHCTTLRLKLPCLVLAATDGCFGYVSTPMEFEGLLLGALHRAENPADWERLMSEAVGAVAGDDHCLCMAGFGFRSFEAMQQALRPRYEWLKTDFLKPLRSLPVEDRQTRMEMWSRYRQGYMQYLKEGAGDA